MALLLLISTAATAQITPNGNVKALVVAPYRLGANYNFNIDDLEEFGFDLTIAGTTDTITQCSWAASLGLLPLISDTLLSEIVTTSPWDAVIIMPASWRSGNSYSDLISSDHVLGLLAEAHQAGKVLYATCAGPRVLAAADLLQGVRVTGNIQIQAELIAAGAIYLGPDTLPVIDSNIVTSSRGMYYHVQNMEAITTALEQSPGKKVARESSINTHNMELLSDMMVWSKTYGGTASEAGRAMLNTQDGGFLIAGYTWSEGAGNSDVLLIRTDAEGSQIWSKTYGGSGWEYGYGLCEASDGGYLITGYSTSWGNGSKDVLLLKVDEDGTEMWHRTFGGDDLDIGRAVVREPDGNILICGYTQSWGNGEDDLLLIKTTTDGSLVWQKTFGGTASDMGRDILVNAFGNYSILGSTGSFGAGNRDIWMLETDTAGIQVWSKTYGDGGYQDGYAFIQSSDHGYLISGQSDLHGIDFLDLYLVCTDSTGNQNWAKRIESPVGFYEYGRDLCETSVGTFLVTGTMKHPLDRSNDVFLSEVNSMGQTLWTETFGGSGSDWASAVSCIGNQDFVIAGHTFSSGSGSSDCWLFKCHLPMTGYGKPNTGKESGMMQPAPNPWDSGLSITITVPEGTSPSLTVVNHVGEICAKLLVQHTGKQTIYWDGRGDSGQQLPAGLYVIVLRYNNETVMRKTIRLNPH